MKDNEKSKARIRKIPLKITLTEAEILEDLHYPVAPERIDSRRAGTDRTRLR